MDRKVKLEGFSWSKDKTVYLRTTVIVEAAVEEREDEVERDGEEEEEELVEKVEGKVRE